MATGGLEESSDSGFSVATGSEAVFDHVCHPCSEEKIKEAIGFCVDCEEWLCEECFRTHKRPKPTRHHVLMDLEEIKNSSSTPKRSDKCTKKCDSHDGKKLKYFCPAHDVLGCSMCIFESHRTCEVQHIPDVSEDIGTKIEFKEVTANLGVVAKESKNIVTEMNNQVEMVKMNKSETVKAFRNYRKKLNEAMDESEAALEAKCEKKEEEETEKLKIIAGKCVALGKESITIKSQLEVLKDRGQHCDAFVALKQCKSKLKTMENNINQAKGSSRVNLYTFRPNLEVGAILNSSEGIGTLVKKRLRTDKDYSNMHTRHVADISVKAENNRTCCITGSTLLPSNKLILADCNNSQIKVVDTNQNKMISELDVDGKPRCVCKVSDCSVVVTIGYKQQIVFLTIERSGKISMKKSIAVSGKCKGVAVIDDTRMVVTYLSPDKMEIMDMDGSILQTIETNNQRENIFHTPHDISLSPDKKCVYISNLGNHTVTRMRLAETITATHVYKDSELQHPEQTAIDSNGMIFVGALGSQNVHLITPDCKKMKVILDESDGLENVIAMSYCEKTQRLYIGMGDCDVIKVFQLS